MQLAIKLTDVCEYLKRGEKSEPKVVQAIDALLGVTLAVSPLVAGPAAFALLPLIAAKNELTKAGKLLFERVMVREDKDLTQRYHRMRAAHGLIVYTAFFEQLDASLPDGARKLLNATGEDRARLAMGARKQRRKPDPEGEVPGNEGLFARFDEIPIEFPHPAESFKHQTDSLLELYRGMATGFLELVRSMDLWAALNEPERAELLKCLKHLPAKALRAFERHYFELCRKFEDFAVWSNLYEHRQGQQLLRQLSEYVQLQADLARQSTASVDVGFEKLQAAVASIPETLALARAEKIAQALEKHYSQRIQEPIIESKEVGDSTKTSLEFPRVCDAFVPQGFKVVRQGKTPLRLEAEETWTNLPRRDDLGAFLLSFLSSPHALDAPLLILGHPGSGKSLLTKVLASRLASRQYTAIRVSLREVNSESPPRDQVEEQIYAITGYRVESWADTSQAFKNSPPVILLDGYDELLQASGRVFRNYLSDVQYFQRNEAEQDRPIRAIVTSRMTLIDKAAVPRGTTIIRLLEFDDRQRARWVSVWNSKNAGYFAKNSVQPFSLPAKGTPEGARVLALAEQPLLLMMLALYDSAKNELRAARALNRTVLYESLLRRFVLREKEKDAQFRALDPAQRESELDRELHRLGVVAIGMYNRRQLHLHSEELEADLRFFELNQTTSIPGTTGLTSADLVLGSFFFVHKSRVLTRPGAGGGAKEVSAFEFLHNTFGEFLAADFIVRQTISQVETVHALASNTTLRGELERCLSDPDGLSRNWYACFAFTPLFSRPVVVQMLAELLDRRLAERGLSRQDFLGHLGEIVRLQVARILTRRVFPAVMQGEGASEGVRAPFGDHALLGHAAIYSASLIVLRAVLTKGPFLFGENLIAPHDDGTRAWEQLAHLWRSWFSIESLSVLASIIRAKRVNGDVEIEPRSGIAGIAAGRRLTAVRSISLALADDLQFGLAGAVAAATEALPLPLMDEVDRRLSSEGIDISGFLAIRKLSARAAEVSAPNAADFFQQALGHLEEEIVSEERSRVEEILGALRRAVERLSLEAREATGPWWHEPWLADDTFLNAAQRCAVRAVESPDGPYLLKSIAEILGLLGGADLEHRLIRVVSRYVEREIERKLHDGDFYEVSRWVRAAAELRDSRLFRVVSGLVIDRRESLAAILEPVITNTHVVGDILGLVGTTELALLAPSKVESLKGLFAPEFVREVIDARPSIGIELLLAGRASLGSRWWEQASKGIFEAEYALSVLTHILKQAPASLRKWCVLARESTGHPLLPEQVAFIFSEGLGPMQLLALAGTDPAAAILVTETLAEMISVEERLRLSGNFSWIAEPGFLRELRWEDARAGERWLEFVAPVLRAEEGGGANRERGFPGAWTRWAISLARHGAAEAERFSNTCRVVLDGSEAKAMAEALEEAMPAPSKVLEIASLDPASAAGLISLAIGFSADGWMSRIEDALVARARATEVARILVGAGEGFLGSILLLVSRMKQEQDRGVVGKEIGRYLEIINNREGQISRLSSDLRHLLNTILVTQQS